MKINLSEMMRIKGRLMDTNSDMKAIFSGINNEFGDISRNIRSAELQQSIHKIQRNILTLSSTFSKNIDDLETFISQQLTSYTVTNEEAKQSLQTLINEVNQTFDEKGNIFLNGAAATYGIGTEISIPSSVRQTGLCPNYTSYSYFYSKWNAGTGQREIADQWGAAGMPSSNGIATLNNRYLVAVSPKFGKVGDDIDIVLSDGQVINATIADMKGVDATSEWGHVLGSKGAVDIIEWEASGSKSDIDLGTWRNVTVDKIVNLKV